MPDFLASPYYEEVYMKLKSGYTFQAYAGIRASSSQDTPSGSDLMP